MKYRIGIFSLLLFGFLFILLQQINEYHFFFIEQNQLFLFTRHYFTEQAILPGGVALYISHFLLQFFIVPYLGALISAGLLTLTATLTALICKRYTAKPLYLLYILPALALLLVHFNNDYLLQGTIAFLSALTALYIHTGISSAQKRLIYAIASTPIIYWLGGSVVNLYAGCVLLWEIISNRKASYLFLIPLALSILLSLSGVWLAWFGEYSFVFLPDIYYNSRGTLPNTIYYSWISLPVIIVLAWYFRQGGYKSKKQEIIGTAVQVVVIIGLTVWLIPQHADLRTMELKRSDYFTRTEQWDKIIKGFDNNSGNYLQLCYLNMALAEQGELAENMFTFPQRDINGLLVTWNKTAYIASLLSNIQFTIGNIAIAQEMAFESYVAAIGDYQPYMLQRLVQTNLIYGVYPVAEKYLDVLGNSLFYRKWADEHRRFLYNDEAVNNDPKLGSKRRGLPAVNYICPSEQGKDFMTRTEFNPENRTAFEYKCAGYLLSKDVREFVKLIEEYYSTEILPELPRSYQEAIMIAYEKQPEQLEKFKISKETVARFDEYRKVLFSNNKSSHLENILKHSFSDTYWFYFMFS